jgi:hypothetical protein
MPGQVPVQVERQHEATRRKSEYPPAQIQVPYRTLVGSVGCRTAGDTCSGSGWSAHPVVILTDSLTVYPPTLTPNSRTGYFNRPTGSKRVEVDVAEDLTV